MVEINFLYACLSHQGRFCLDSGSWYTVVVVTVTAYYNITPEWYTVNSIENNLTI